MDYDLGPSELELLARVGALVDERGGPQRLLPSAASGRFDADLDAAFAGNVTSSAPRHQRLLVVEESARRGLPALPGPRLLVGCEVLGEIPTRPVAVADRRRPGPLRLPPTGALLLSFADDEAWVAEVEPASVTSIPSSFGYPFAEVPIDEGLPLPPGSAARLRTSWHLTLACEIAGTAHGALQQLTSYLRQREQFGKRLAKFQALRHRVAELAVSTDAALWLAREAAWHGGGQRAGLAAVYARELAARMAPELVQLSGARGFTLEFPLHLFAMRLEGLRLTLGSGDRLAREVMTVSDPATMR
jgi:hypothetical protein